MVKLLEQRVVLVVEELLAAAFARKFDCQFLVVHTQQFDLHLRAQHGHFLLLLLLFLLLLAFLA